MTKPKNKQWITILTVVAAVFIVWLFLRNRMSRSNNNQNSDGSNQTITNPGDTSWLDKLLDGLAAAGAPFNINIPAMLGYVPKDYPIISGGGTSNYNLPHPSNSGSGCSFCMKTPEGLPPVSKPAPAPAPIMPPPRPMMSFGSSRAVVPYSPPPIYPWSTGRM